MSIQNILDRKGADVFTIEPTATVRTAAYLMRARGIAALVVKSGDVISGLISERDVAHAIAQHGDRALSMAASDVMTRSAITVTPGDTLRRAMTLMTNHRLRHLIVMANGHLVGIVSIGDVVVSTGRSGSGIECPAGRLHSSAPRCNGIPPAGRADAVRAATGGGACR